MHEPLISGSAGEKEREEEVDILWIFHGYKGNRFEFVENSKKIIATPSIRLKLYASGPRETVEWIGICAKISILIGSLLFAATFPPLFTLSGDKLDAILLMLSTMSSVLGILLSSAVRVTLYLFPYKNASNILEFLKESELIFIFACFCCPIFSTMLGTASIVASYFTKDENDGQQKIGILVTGLLPFILYGYYHGRMMMRLHRKAVLFESLLLDNKTEEAQGVLHIC